MQDTSEWPLSPKAVEKLKLLYDKIGAKTAPRPLSWYINGPAILIRRGVATSFSEYEKEVETHITEKGLALLREVGHIK